MSNHACVMWGRWRAPSTFRRSPKRSAPRRGWRPTPLPQKRRRVASFLIEQVKMSPARHIRRGPPAVRAGGVSTRVARPDTDSPTPAGVLFADSPTPAGVLFADSPTPAGVLFADSPTPAGVLFADSPTPAGVLFARRRSCRSRRAGSGAPLCGRTRIPRSPTPAPSCSSRTPRRWRARPPGPRCVQRAVVPTHLARPCAHV
jgi:hypothetical protein